MSNCAHLFNKLNNNRQTLLSFLNLIHFYHKMPLAWFINPSQTVINLDPLPFNLS